MNNGTFVSHEVGGLYPVFRELIGGCNGRYEQQFGDKPSVELLDELVFGLSKRIRERLLLVETWPAEIKAAIAIVDKVVLEELHRYVRRPMPTATA